MSIIIILFICLILISVVALWLTITYNNIQHYIIRLNEVEANIDRVLRKRFDLLNKSIGIIKTNTETEDDVLVNVVKLRSRKLSNFELDREIYLAINEFESFSEKFPVLKTCESYLKIVNGINETEIEIYALRGYYNDIVTLFNKSVRSFPSNLIAHASKLKEKAYFDGKDMYDEVINDFKL